MPPDREPAPTAEPQTRSTSRCREADADTLEVAPPTAGQHVVV